MATLEKDLELPEDLPIAGSEEIDDEIVLSEEIADETALQQLDILKRLKSLVKRYPSISLAEIDRHHTKLCEEGYECFGYFWEELIQDVINNKPYTEDWRTRLVLDYQGTGHKGKLARIIGEFINLSNDVFRREPQVLQHGEEWKNDFRQEAALGIVRGARKYRLCKRATFSTYVYWWIYQAIKRAFHDQAKVIRLPVHVGEKVDAYGRALSRLHHEYGAEPSIEEIAAQMKMPPEKVAALGKLIRGKVNILSLDQKLGEDSDALDFYGYLHDPAPEVVDRVVFNQLFDAVNDSLTKLPPRDRQIIEMRFGINGYKKPHTFGEIAGDFGLTRERIRQIVIQALDKLQRKLATRGYKSSFEPNKVGKADSGLVQERVLQEIQEKGWPPRKEAVSQWLKNNHDYKSFEAKNAIARAIAEVKITDRNGVLDIPGRKETMAEAVYAFIDGFKGRGVYRSEIAEKVNINGSLRKLLISLQRDGKVGFIKRGERPELDVFVSTRYIRRKKQGVV